VAIYILAWASALLVSMTRAKARASTRGTSNKYSSHVFLFYLSASLGELAKHKNYTIMNKEVYEQPTMQVVELELQGAIADPTGGFGNDNEG